MEKKLANDNLSSDDLRRILVKELLETLIDI